MTESPATFYESAGSMFSKTYFREIMRTFLLSEAPPITSMGVFAPCVSIPETPQASLLGNVGFGALPEGRKFPVRKRVAAAWSRARNRFDEVRAADNPKGPQAESAIASENLLSIMRSFRTRYAYSHPMDRIPSERNLGLLRTVWRRRSAKPIPPPTELSVKVGGGPSTEIHAGRRWGRNTCSSYGARDGKPPTDALGPTLYAHSKDPYYGPTCW